MAGQPLSGYKVLDLTHHIAGPFCTKMFADFGAEVLKVERPGTGDPARMLGPFLNDIPDPEKSGLFLHLNTNKKGITLNLKSPTGKAILMELVKDTDVLVENFAPRVMPGLGLGYEVLSEANPDLIMTSISNFGQTGPYRDYLASELILFSMGGKMNRNGLPDRYPLKQGANHVQYQAGNNAASATMYALYGRQYAGIGGQWIDISIFETQLQSCNLRNYALTMYSYTGERGVRILATGGYPSGVYPAQDGYVALSGGMGFWGRTVAMLGRPELRDDPRFAGPLGQLSMEGKAEFESTIWFPWVGERTKMEVLENMQQYRILSGALNNVGEVVESDQCKARNYFVTIDHPAAGSFRYCGAPVKTADDWWQVRYPAPLLGQHNEEILCQGLGYSKEDLVLLRSTGVI